MANAQPAVAHAYADSLGGGEMMPALLRVPLPPMDGFEVLPDGSLAGRTMVVGSSSEIVLNPGEVILTFDDGPRPGRTEAILDALDLYEIKATFLMVGRMADAHPATAREVALRGHTIGTHTYDHTNLADHDHEVAFADIRAGQAALRRALAVADLAPSPFFRFPYLAQTQFLRTSLALDQAIVLGVDVDSKDYYDSTPDEVLERTLDRLDARGSGIVLFHDIHARTVLMMPKFLQALQDRGYSVVRLRAKGDGAFDRDLVTATNE